MAVIIMALIALVLAQTLIIRALRRELGITRRVRLGYEKKCNTFKLKYTLLSKLEDAERVRRNLRKLPQPIYLYGGGVIGDKLLSAIEKDGGIEVLRVIEGRGLAEDPEYGKGLRPELKVIVTPMFDYENICRLLSRYFEEDSIVGLEELLE